MTPQFAGERCILYHLLPVSGAGAAEGGSRMMILPLKKRPAGGRDNTGGGWKLTSSAGLYEALDTWSNQASEAVGLGRQSFGERMKDKPSSV